MPRNKEQNERMRAQSKRQIMDAARQLFAEHGYYTCKMTDIARKAEMSTGNVYYYYPSKQEVLKAILADGFETHEEVLREASANLGTAEEKLHHLVEQYLAFCQEQSAFFAVLISILGHSGDSYLEALGFDMRAIGASFHHHLTAVLVQGQAEGTVIDLEPNVLAMFFFSLFNGLLLTYGEDWHVLPPEVIQGAVLRLVGSK
jgi:TetR/AcrR family fatty acid metabolism transcriptional regulator